MEMAEHTEFMKRALELAERGRGFVNPNPMVGAVVVRDGHIIGEGWHERYGGLHAERNALAHCTEDPAGATLYVTLEPCCHYGKTPPCTEAIIAARIARVMMASDDPNPLVAGKGVEILRKAGIEVITGVCREEADRLNRVFMKYISTRMPWIVMKAAMTLDGKIATSTGDSKWVSCDRSRETVHRMRAWNMGILAGAGTVLADDPMLNCRMEGDCRQPVRIIMDSSLSIPLESRIVATAREYRTIMAHTAVAGRDRMEKLHAAGVETLLCEADGDGRVDVVSLCRQLGKAGIDSILLEGGGTVNDSFLRASLVDEVYMFIAPKMVGGACAKTPVEGIGVSLMSDAVKIGIDSVDMSGDDVLVHGYVLR